MEFGFENKKKLYAFGGCVLVLLLAVLYAINSWPSADSSSPPVPSAVANSSPSSAPQTAAAYRQKRRLEALDIYKVDPTIHVEKLEQTNVADYAGSKRNLFRYEAPPPPPPPKKTLAEIKREEEIRRNQPPPPPPPPPPIDLKYYGFATEKGTNVRKVFLTNGNDIFIAGEGDVVANRYKVLRIGVNSVEVEDLQNKNRQQLPLTES